MVGRKRPADRRIGRSPLGENKTRPFAFFRLEDPAQDRAIGKGHS